MKIPFSKTAAALCLSLACQAAAFADLGILVEYFELDERMATPLIREHAGKADATELREILQKKVEAGEVRIVSTSFVRTISQQRVKVESIHELIYPTEFDPPEVPQTLSGPIDPGVDITTPSSPTAFEMRPVGDTLEADPRDAGEGFIDLNLAIERVEFVDYLTYGKDESESKQPLFYTTKMTTAVRVRDGKYTLVGVQTPRKRGAEGIVTDESRRVLVLLRASSLDGERERERPKGGKQQKP